MQHGMCETLNHASCDQAFHFSRVWQSHLRSTLAPSAACQQMGYVVPCSIPRGQIIEPMDRITLGFRNAFTLCTNTEISFDTSVSISTCTSKRDSRPSCTSFRCIKLSIELKEAQETHGPSDKVMSYQNELKLLQLLVPLQRSCSC